jgi:hypothetical protein
MVVLAYVGRQDTTFHAAEWTGWFVILFYLESCISPDLILWLIRHRVYVEFCANLWKGALEILTMIRQTFEDESGSHTEVFEWESPNSPGLNEARQVKSKVKNIWHQVDCSQRINPGRPNSQFCILVWCFTVSENVRRLHPKLRWQRTGCCITVMYHFFTRKLLTNMAIIPYPPYSLDFATCNFSLFPQLKIPPFRHNWCDQGRTAGGAAHPHRTLFQNACITWQKFWEGCIRVETDRFEGDGCQ